MASLTLDLDSLSPTRSSQPRAFIFLIWDDSKKPSKFPHMAKYLPNTSSAGLKFLQPQSSNLVVPLVFLVSANGNITPIQLYKTETCRVSLSFPSP